MIVNCFEKSLYWLCCCMFKVSMFQIYESIFWRALVRICRYWAYLGERRVSVMFWGVGLSILLLNIITFTIMNISNTIATWQLSKIIKYNILPHHNNYPPLFSPQQYQYNSMQKQSSLPEPKELTTQQSTSSSRQTNLQTIHQTKTNLDSLIEQLNTKLHSHFHKKQSELIEQYKQELIAAQKELNQLKSNTNEEQIKNKMIERKKQLEKERHQLIQTNMFFSNKCEDYKRKLALLVAQGKELEKQLLFLDGQINNAYKKKYQAISQQDHTPPHNDTTPAQQKQQLPAISQTNTHTLPLFSDRKTNEKISNKLASSVSVRDTTKKAILEESLASKGKRNILRAQLPSSSKLTGKQIEKTALEELFQSTVQQVRGKRKGKKGIPALKGEEFSDYEKKQIMEEFLSREEVKRKIYEIIFENDDKRPVLPGSFQPQGTKIKISFEDIN